MQQVGALHPQAAFGDLHEPTGLAAVLVGPHAVDALPFQSILELSDPGRRGLGPPWQRGPQTVEFLPPVDDRRLAALHPLLLPHDLLQERQGAEVVLARGFGRRLCLADHRLDAGHAFVGLRDIVGEIRPGTFRIGFRDLLEGANRLVAAADERLESGDATGQQVVDLRLRGDDALEQGDGLRDMMLGRLHVLDRSLHFARIEELGREGHVLPRLDDVHLRIGTGLGEQPALGPAALDLFLGLVGCLGRLESTVISGLEGIDPRDRAGERRRRLFEAAAGLDRIGFQPVPGQREAA